MAAGANDETISGAQLRDRLGHPIDFTCADNISIIKGAVLKLLDARTASGAITAADPIAGIAAREKVSGDGRTQLAVYRTGIFDMHASGSAIALGANVCAAGSNSVGAVNDTLSGAQILGTALETISDGEVGQIQLNYHQI